MSQVEDGYIFHWYTYRSAESGCDHSLLVRTDRPGPDDCDPSQVEQDLGQALAYYEAHALTPACPEDHSRELAGRCQGLPIGDALYESSFWGAIDFWVAETEAGQPWVVLGAVKTEEEFWSGLRPEEHAVPPARCIKGAVFFARAHPARVLGALASEIERAFAGVLPGKIGVRAASALDDYIQGEELEAVRRRDIESDWRDIPDEVIESNPSILSYFDPEGLKFATPAILRWSLKGFNLQEDLSFYLFLTLLPATPEANVGSIIDSLRLDLAQIGVVARWLKVIFDELEAESPREAKNWRDCLREWERRAGHGA